MRREGVGVSPSTAASCASRVAGACLEHAMTLLPDIPDAWSIDGLEVTIRKSLEALY